MFEDLERQMDALERQEVVEVTVEPRLGAFQLVFGPHLVAKLVGHVGRNQARCLDFPGPPMRRLKNEVPIKPSVAGKSSDSADMVGNYSSTTCLAETSPFRISPVSESTSNCAGLHVAQSSAPILQLTASSHCTSQSCGLIAASPLPSASLF